MTSGDMVEEMARAMCAASRPSADPDADTAAARGQLGTRKVWQLYEPMAQAAATIAKGRIAELTERLCSLHEALTPSGDTKAAYSGEFSFTVIDRDEDGEEVPRKVLVPWTTIKEIMAAILARAALKDSPNVG